MKRTILFLIPLLTLTYHSFAVNRTWVGASGGDFNTAGNWSPAGIPSAADNITISSGNMVINMSASATINNFTVTCTGGGARLLIFNTNGNTLTVNGVTSVGAGSLDEVEIHAGSSTGGFIFNGDVTFDNGFGTGLTQIKADLLNEGSMTFNANLSTGAYAFTEPGVEPKFFFDGNGTQSWTFTSSLYFIVPQSIQVGVANTPIVNFIGAGDDFRLNIYDGALTVSANCTLDIGNYALDQLIIGSGALTVGAGAMLRIGGTNDFPIDFTANNLNATSTVEYYGTNQDVDAHTYGHLLLTGSGTKTSQGNFSINGNFTSNTTWDDGNDTHTFSGSVTQNISGTSAPTFYNLTINNSSATGVNLNTDVTVDRNLTFSNGRINTNANVLAITDNNTARVSGYNTTRYVNTGSSGTFRRYLGTTGSYDMPVGNSTSYQLVNINLTSGNTATYLDVNFDNIASGTVGFPFYDATYQYIDLLNNGGPSVGVGNANYGVWSVVPDAGTANYDVTLYGRNHDTEGSLRHTVVRRTAGGGTVTEISENFDGCSGSAPAGWSTNITSGSDDWVFNSTTFSTFTIDGSCMASFDDDAAGSGQNNTVELYSPVVDMSGYASGTLTYDYNHQDYFGSGNFTVEVYDGSVWQQVFFTSVDGSGNRVENITAYLNASFQIRWVYDDDNDWAWGAGVDNVVLEGVTPPGPYGNWLADGTYSSSTVVTPITAARTGYSGYGTAQFGIGGSSSILPVELTLFDVECSNEGVQIQWQTATEINNDYFVIEKSSDAVSYDEVTTINGQGTSNIVNSYSYTDVSTGQLTYYRLKQVDYDGTTTYHEVKSVNCVPSQFEVDKFSFTETGLKFNIAATASESLQIFMYDYNGRLIANSSSIIEKGNNAVNFNNIDWSEGVYMLSLIGDKHSYTRKLIKLDN